MDIPRSSKDLPANKFITELNRYGRYDMLDEYVKEYRTASITEEWVKSFISEVGNYLKNNSEWKTTIDNKRCRDWHYYIFNIKENIKKLKDGGSNLKSKWISDIDQFSENILSDTDISMCSSDAPSDYADFTKKLFNDLCENCYYISDRLEDVKNSLACSEIKTALSRSKSILDDLLEDVDASNFYKSNICKKKDIEDLISSVACHPVIDVQASDSRRISGELSMHTEGVPGQGDETPRSKEDGINSMDQILQIATPSTLSVLGVSLIGFMLYKFTSFGRLFNNTLLNKKNHNDNLYEGVLQFSEHTSQFEEMNFQSSSYNITYQPE
ncbi:PIR Superfamily Protein [Plasmodium ovale wallikeri]|uniref:PIR Superfamily Protein n=1 Tax=Plasmodium ovale wallikeri TaxID=864142 RepID=A0A1A9A5M7_PLAOA|nr:PIR Superfamily Protein [Plasmodium ovale wallikeri]SBT54044.1 PIR Superfamily Protein [Plasmodium ovale wallikeri]